MVPKWRRRRKERKRERRKGSRKRKKRRRRKGSWVGREVGVNPRVEGGINMNQNTLYKILKYYLKKIKSLG